MYRHPLAPSQKSDSGAQPKGLESVNAPAAVPSLQGLLGNQQVQQQLLSPTPEPVLATANVVQRRLGVTDSVAIMNAADQWIEQLPDHAVLRQYWLHNVHRQLVRGFDNLDTAKEALGRWFEAIADNYQDVEHIKQAWEKIVADYPAPKPDRPPANPRNLGPNAKTQAMEKAQEVNDRAQSLFEHNIDILQRNSSAVFYVFGKSAMGQGDTAFIVRTVNLLKSLGLKAVGVKAEKSAHDPGTSFQTSLDYITPDMLFLQAKSGDFVIEGPLSDPFTQPTWFDTVADKFTIGAKDIRNLRLYEYGTLTYRGGQQMQQPTDANVVKYAGDPRHAFMGLGHGEIGAFYNANASKEMPSLEQVLKEHAENSITVKEIQAVLGRHAGATIFIGYANSSEVAYKWASAVQQAVGGKKPSGYSLIVAVYGGKQTKPKFDIDDSVSISWILDRKKESAKSGEPSVHPSKNATGSIILTDSVPAPVMNALQLCASPFTLATGNYSLSEAIERGHLASYETLNFNAGVEADYKWQLQNAMTNLEFGQDLKDAVMALVSPGNLKMKAREIQLVLEHPNDIERIMAEIRANTDITKLLVGRLAAL